jgi:hypothetical protein
MIVEMIWPTVMSHFHRLLLTALLVTVLLSSPPSMRAAGANDDAGLVCLSNLEQIALVESNEIIPLSAAINTRKVQKRGRVIRARLCKNGKRYLYVITLMSDAGQIATVTVRATPKAAKIRFRLAKSCYYHGHKWLVGSICKYQCFGESCPRQYCKSNGEWTPLPPCGRYVSCLVYSDCGSR